MSRNASPRGNDVLTADVDEPSDAANARGGLALRVLSESSLTLHALPREGAPVIGRGDDADIRIDHPSISRRHAILRMGSALSIEDCGSSNGTRVREQRFGAGEVAPVALGEVIELGSATVVIAPAARSDRAQRVRTHARFEEALRAACDEPARGVTIARLHVAGPVQASAVEERLLRELPPDAVSALYGAGEYEMLLRARRASAESLIRPLAARLTAAGAEVRVGFAAHPEDGRTPEALIAAACAEVTGRASDDGGMLVVEGGGLQRLLPLVDRIAAASISVLLLGETGVGKELVAAAIHQRSPRAAGRFLRLNCAALPETLLESELFGYEKGAFSGAVAAKPGLLENAGGGTVFLDEVGEIPASMQSKLLRVLEERQVLRLGSLAPRPIDVRFIAATNRDLEQEVDALRFRQDLYFRLNGIALVVPPLRDRTVEVGPLARSFLARAARGMNRPPPILSAEALSLLERYRWPGNVREPKNAMERAVILCDGDTITPEHLPHEKMTRGEASVTSRSIAPAPETRRAPATMQPPAEAPAGERERILEVLARCAGNQTQAAKALGISRNTLAARLEQYGLPRPRKR